MLQQTQVERVIPFYKKFIKKFPTAGRLASAPLASVIQEWQGLGYNRRAKMLQRAAKEIRAKRNGKFSKSITELEKLPGIGPYTARAVTAFAYNQDVIFIETNIRTAIICHFFAKKDMIYHTSVSDAQIAQILERLLPRGRAREWYSALMDYGAYLKILKILSGALASHPEQGEPLLNLLKLFGHKRRAQMRTALAALEREGLIQKTRRSYRLAE